MMNTASFNEHSEYVFNKAELLALLNSSAGSDDAFYVTIGFECSGATPSNRVYTAKIEGSVGTYNGKSGGSTIEGCPKPPGCPGTILDSVEITAI